MTALNTIAAVLLVLVLAWIALGTLLLMLRPDPRTDEEKAWDDLNAHVRSPHDLS